MHVTVHHSHTREHLEKVLLTGTGSENTHVASCASYYLTSTSIAVEIYQDLVDRGWRRSGNLFYKPDVLRHCCPHYTIRLPASSFTPSKHHRQALNRWNTHVLGDAHVKAAARLHPKSKEDKVRDRSGFDLTEALHLAEYANVKLPPEPQHRFEVTLEPDKFSQEKYQLFRNYQQHVHHEKPHEISESGFKRFLCGSPLQRKTSQAGDKPQPLGSYHQCYRLDGRLIAMGVLDLLPHCVSGVYFLYHSDFEAWNFGKMSALREAALARDGGYEYYYMGYYIHSCVKMRYKGEYKPQFVLDPESFEWHPLDGEMRRLLDRKSFVSLSRERRRGDTVATQAEPKIGEGSVDKSVDDNNDDNDDYVEYPLPSAKEAGDAVTAGMSLFDLKIPGVMTAEEIDRDYALDQQRIAAHGRTFEAADLVRWQDESITDPKSLKGVIAELVACMGPDAAKQVVIGF